MNRRSRTRQIIDLLYFEQHRLYHIMAQQFKAAVVEQRENIFAAAREKIVEANNIVPLRNQSLAQMRADKTRAARHQNSHSLLQFF